MFIGIRNPLLTGNGFPALQFKLKININLYLEIKMSTITTDKKYKMGDISCPVRHIKGLEQVDEFSISQKQFLLDYHFYHNYTELYIKTSYMFIKVLKQKLVKRNYGLSSKVYICTRIKDNKTFIQNMREYMSYAIDINSREILVKRMQEDEDEKERINKLIQEIDDVKL